MISQMGINSNCIRLHRGFVWRNPLEHPFRRSTIHMVPAHPSHPPASSAHLHQEVVGNHRSHTSHCQNQEQVHGHHSFQRTFHSTCTHTSYLLITSRSLRIIIAPFSKIFFFCLFASGYCIIKRIKITNVFMFVIYSNIRHPHIFSFVPYDTSFSRFIT